jgi:SAM-dependent methyltransferase
VACTSLHHVSDLDQVLDRAAAALAPGGVLIVVEWAYEKFEEATARWTFDRLPSSGEQGWLHSHREQWLASGQPWHTYLDDWARREGLHSGHAIIQVLQARFHTRLLTHAPYFFPDLHPISETDEQAAADSDEIRATLPAAWRRPALPRGPGPRRTGSQLGPRVRGLGLIPGEEQPVRLGHVTACRPG